MECNHRANDIRKLALRALEPGDAALLYEVENDAEAWDDGDTVAPYSMHTLEEYARSYRADPFADRQLRLIAVDTESGEPAGIADLYGISRRNMNAYAAVYILPRMRGRGIGRRVVELLTGYASRRLGLTSVAARIRVSNTVSRRLFASCGYREAGMMRAWQRTAAGMEDVVVVQRMLGGDSGQLSAGSEGTESQLR